MYVNDTDQAIGLTFDVEDYTLKQIQIHIINDDGEKYTMSVKDSSPVSGIISQSVAHFFNFKETTTNADFRLINVKTMTTLIFESTVLDEKLSNNDHLLLVKGRESREIEKANSKNAMKISQTIINEKVSESCMKSKNQQRNANPLKADLDFKTAFRQIILTMIEASVHLIASESDAGEHFFTVFEHLIKRHKPRVNKCHMKQLMNQGYSEACSIIALQIAKNSLEEAKEWLNNDILEESERDLMKLATNEQKHNFFFQDKDPTEKVMTEYFAYIDRWLIPDLRTIKALTALNKYTEKQIKDAVKESSNIEKIARELLEGNHAAKERTRKGFDRSSPIMSAILDSSVVQTALIKPKTLFALMVLCENPNNVNVWLSDQETHAVVSQILRIYHAEKHRIDNEDKKDSVEDSIPMDLDESSHSLISKEIHVNEYSKIPFLFDQKLFI